MFYTTLADFTVFGHNEETAEPSYIAFLFYKQITTVNVDFVFVIVKHLESHLEVKSLIISEGRRSVIIFFLTFCDGRDVALRVV